MIQKTKEYSKFKMREDNRACIDSPHLARIKNSIETRNFLHLRPITVNEQMEILDGQHRFLAAKELGLEIFYEITKGSDPKDLVLLNISKPWSGLDYLNFYTKNGYKHYIKLQNFIKKHQLKLATAMQLSCGRSFKGMQDFKIGKYEFTLEDSDDLMDFCKDTVEFIKTHNGTAIWMNSSKFWVALVQLMRLPDFNKEKWFRNLKHLVKSCTAKITLDEYYQMVLDIYNNPTMNHTENQRSLFKDVA